MDQHIGKSESEENLPPDPEITEREAQTHEMPRLALLPASDLLELLGAGLRPPPLCEEELVYLPFCLWS